MPMEGDRAGPTHWLSATGWFGVALGAIGGVLMFVGWFRISGESLIALQLPYLASASIPGAALVIAGGALVAGESARRNAADSAQMIATLFDLLTEASAPPASGLVAATGQPLFCALPDGTRYHRSGCALVDAKPDVMPVDPDAIRERGLRPCPMCGPAQIDE